MSKTEIRSTNAPRPGGAYSQGLKVQGSLVYTAGVGPLDPVSQAVVGSTIEEQTHQVLQNLRAIIEEAGLTLDKVVKTTVFLENLDRDFDGFNRVYGEFFSPPYPVRTTVGAHLKNILVEIDLVAAAD